MLAIVRKGIRDNWYLNIVFFVWLFYLCFVCLFLLFVCFSGYLFLFNVYWQCWSSLEGDTNAVFQIINVFEYRNNCFMSMLFIYIFIHLLLVYLCLFYVYERTRTRSRGYERSLWDNWSEFDVIVFMAVLFVYLFI